MRSLHRLESNYPLEISTLYIKLLYVSSLGDVLLTEYTYRYLLHIKNSISILQAANEVISVGLADVYGWNIRSLKRNLLV